MVALDALNANNDVSSINWEAFEQSLGNEEYSHSNNDNSRMQMDHINSIHERPGLFAVPILQEQSPQTIWINLHVCDTYKRQWKASRRVSVAFLAAEY